MPTDTRSYKVYCYTNNVNGKKYIGITCRSLRERASGRYEGSHRFRNAINKYGFDKFIPEILFDNLTRDEACRREIETIREFNTTDGNFGYNISLGGQSPSHTPEVRKKISESRKGVVFTEEHRKKLSLAKFGKPSARKDWHPTKEMIEKVRKANTGRKQSKEEREKRSKAMKGKTGHTWSEEQRKRVSEMMKGRVSPMKGKKMSEEARKKISIAKKGKPTWNNGKILSERHIRNLIIGHNPKIAECTEIGITGTVRELSEVMGINAHSIYDVLAGRRKQVKKFTFKWR